MYNLFSEYIQLGDVKGPHSQSCIIKLRFGGVKGLQVPSKRNWW